MHPSQSKLAAPGDVGGLGADMPAMPGQLALHEMSADDLAQLLTRFRKWLDEEWAGAATVVPIESVRSYFGWPRR